MFTEETQKNNIYYSSLVSLLGVAPEEDLDPLLAKECREFMVDKHSVEELTSFLNDLYEKAREGRCSYFVKVELKKLKLAS